MILPALYVHQLDPFLLRLWDDVGLRWYGLSYVAGFLVALLVLTWLSRRKKISLTPTQINDFVVYLALGTIVGGRLGYCLFYEPSLLTDFSPSFPFWGVFAVWRGGMASHGGMIGVITAVCLFARRHRLSTLHLLDLVALLGPIGIFFGRIANFINGELVGRPAPASLPWAVKFPTDILTWPTDQLRQLSPAVAPLGIHPAVWQSYLADPSPLAQSAIHRTLEKILAAVQHHNPQVLSALSPLLTPRHPSQLYEALLEGLLIFLALLFLWRKPRKPGLIAGVFLTLYPLVRIAGEQFRMPDAQIGFQALGLTRGQWLSIAMLAVGISLLLYWARRNVPPIGGWGRKIPPA